MEVINTKPEIKKCSKGCCGSNKPKADGNVNNNPSDEIKTIKSIEIAILQAPSKEPVEKSGEIPNQVSDDKVVKKESCCKGGKCSSQAPAIIAPVYIINRHESATSTLIEPAIQNDPTIDIISKTVDITNQVNDNQVIKKESCCKRGKCGSKSPVAAPTIIASEDITPNHDHNTTENKQINLTKSNDTPTHYQSVTASTFIPAKKEIPPVAIATKSGCCSQAVKKESSCAVSPVKSTCCSKAPSPLPSPSLDHDHGVPKVKACCASSSSCCGSHMSHHDHDHRHSEPGDEDGACCGSTSSCCGADQSVKAPLLKSADLFDYSHGHDHDHTAAEDSACCDDESCSASKSHVIAPSSCCGSTHHGHNYDHDHAGVDHAHRSSPRCDDEACSLLVSTTHSTILGLSPLDLAHNTTATAAAAALSDNSTFIVEIDQKCSSCDATSSIPHALQITRFRIANLCCAGEERIILASLSGMHGIDRVDVNVIGRYAIVKHCAVICCAPSELIIQKLNAKHLGASVAEAFGEENEEDEETISLITILHLASVLGLFLLGIIVSESTRNLANIQAGTALYLTSAAIGLLPVLYAAWRSVCRLTIDIHILMIIATIGAIALGEYFDASLLMFLFAAAEALEQVIMARVRRAVRVNTGNVAKHATLVSGKAVLLSELVIGDVLAVRAGEMIMADGVVKKGEGVVDESSLTGEAKPISKRTNDTVSSGTIVQNGYIEVSVSKLPGESTLNALHNEMLAVQADKGVYGRLVDRISVYWTPAVLLMAFCIAVIGGGVSRDWDTYVYKVQLY